MASLKQYLRKALTEKRENLARQAEIVEGSLQALVNRTRLEPANYEVKMRSLWDKEGDETTTTEHRGRLRDAIEAAEKDFCEANKSRRGDKRFQAKYTVTVRLGEAEYTVPEEFYGDLRRGYPEETKRTESSRA